MLTVYENTDLIFKALAAGASGYMLKQTPPTELLAAMRDVHKGGSPMTSHIARKVVASFRQSGSSAKELESLTTREQEVLEFLAKGFLYKEIADAMSISYDTVHTHIRKIYEKLPCARARRPWRSGWDRGCPPARLRRRFSISAHPSLTRIGDYRSNLRLVGCSQFQMTRRCLDSCDFSVWPPVRLPRWPRSICATQSPEPNPIQNPPPLMKKSILLLNTTLAVLATASAFGASQSWSNAPVSPNWVTAANWVSNAVPAPVNSTTTADIATFNSPIGRPAGLVAPAVRSPMTFSAVSAASGLIPLVAERTCSEVV